MFARLRITLLTAAFALLAFAPGAWAAPGVSVTMMSSAQLTLDSNAPCTGPQAAYVSFRITNTSGTMQTNLRAAISGFAGGIALGGGQAAGQYVGTLAAGASRTLFWFVSYPCTFGLSNTLVVSVTDNTPGSTTGTGTVATSSMISAQAGGIVNTATLGAGAVVGQTITLDVAYDFGGASAGDTYNLQPAGNNTFNGGCFQLVRTTVLASNVPAVPAGRDDQLFFTATASATGNKYSLTMRYSFKYLCEGVTTQAKPYSNQTSGTQLKYSANYHTFVGPSFPGATNPFVVTKSVTPAIVPCGGTVTYTVTISNPSPYASEADSIVDVLPAGIKFAAPTAASQINAANSGSVPAGNSTGTLVWRGSPSYSLPAGGSATLSYTASVIDSAGAYTNTVRALTGNWQLGNTASATATVQSADVAVAKTGPATSVVSDTIRYALTLSNAGPGPSLATVVNVAAASASTTDPAPANNDGSAPASRVTTTVTSSVVVTPDGLSSPTPRLAGGAYGQAFNVQNVSPVSGSYALSLRTTAADPAAVFIAVDSVTGPGIAAPASYATATVPLAGRTTTVYTVWYRVLAGDTAVNTQFLAARAVSDTLLRDDGFAEVRRVRPMLTLTKSVSPTGTLASGTDLTYTLNIANVGEYAARSVTVTDSVPTQVMFKLGSISQTLPPGLTATVAYRDSTGAPVTPGGNAACVAAAGYDSCVRRIVWTLSGDLPAGASLSDGQFVFIARIK
jgi:uncharacterized repeat protein (TIGR01451 family)